MPIAEINGVSLHYEICGSVKAPLVAFSNSLGSDLHMWDKVLPYVEQDFRILCYDTRGHGLSSTPESKWTIESLASDLIGLLDILGVESAHVCGLSLGGMVSQWLGIYAPRRVRRLVFANTAARIGTPEAWDARIAAVEAHGMQPIAYSAIDRWFTPEYIRQRPGEMSLMKAMIEHTPKAGYIGCCKILRDTDLRSDTSRIETPSMVIAGTHDPATTASEGQQLHAGLKHAHYVELNASHLSAWECPEEFAETIRTFFLEEHSRG